MTGADPRHPSASFPADAVRACLVRVATSPQFVRSRRLTHFLRFTVEARLEGRADELKERTIAIEVYGRRLDYDPRCDPIVRSEAHRLRAKLDAYYAGEGSDDPLVIELPKGRYLPAFRRNPGTNPGHARAGSAVSEPRQLAAACSASSSSTRSPPMRWPAWRSSTSSS